MTDDQFYIVWGAALEEKDKDAFVSDWTLSSMFADENEMDINPELVDELEAIYKVAHMSVRDIVAESGLSQIAFARKFCISRRTIGNWCTGKRKCPDYNRLMFCRLLGILQV